MAKPYTERYKDQKFSNPGDYVDPKVKQGTKDGSSPIQKEWFLKKCQFIYGSYMRDDSFIPYSHVIDYRINRMYAQGMQPNTKYKESLTVKDRDSALRKGWMNISWDILPILPKFRSLVLGRFEDIDYNINIRAIDEFSSSAREDAKLNVMVESKHGEYLKEFRVAIGLPEDPQENEGNMPYTPKSIEEFEMMASLGAFKLAWEISMDKLLNDTAAKNNWQEIKRRLFEDAVDLGIMAVKDYQDPNTHKPMCRYVDPENLIIRQTRRNDFWDVTEAAEICWYTLEQLKAMGLSDTELKEAAHAYNSLWGNATLFPGTEWSQSRYSTFKVAVLDSEFQSFDTYFYESRAIDGKEVVFDLPFDTKKPKGKDRGFAIKEKEKFYRSKWVIGTSVVFDYGPQYDVPYDQYDKPKCSYSVYRIADRSMVNQCISVADDIQMAVYKFRNAIATARPPGIMVEWGSITNIGKGGSKMDPWDVLKIYNDQGNLIFKYPINPANGMPIQGGIPPVTELKGGVGPYLTEITSAMNWGIDMIREITGLNAVVDASAPAPNALVGTAKIAEAGTNHVLRPMLAGYKSVKQRCNANLCNRWQMTGMFYPQSVVVTGVGNAAYETIKVGKDFYKPVFDVFADALIADEDKMRIEGALQQSMQAAKTGSIGITMGDYFYIHQIIAMGNMRWAWAYLNFREAKMKADAMLAESQRNAEIAKATQELEAQKNENALMLIKEAEKQKRLTLAFEYKLKKDLELSVARINARKETTNQ